MVILIMSVIRNDEKVGCAMRTTNNALKILSGARCAPYGRVTEKGLRILKWPLSMVTAGRDAWLWLITTILFFSQ
ncbi:MAG: hypothetical protein CMI00_15930 [Oceanospirillaceae bacterium]|nr:hypothetical protein [Oceanospirillaceae bacterium]